MNKQNILIVGLAAAISLLIAPLNAYAPTSSKSPTSTSPTNSSSNDNNGCPAGYYRPYPGLGCILTLSSTSGCGPGTDNSTCTSSSIKPTTHKPFGDNITSSIGSQIITNKGNSPTPTPCPEQGPIPPNCTKKLIIK